MTATVSVDGLKRCSKCKAPKNVKAPWCSSCKKAYDKERYAKQGDKIRKQCRQYIASHGEQNRKKGTRLE